MGKRKAVANIPYDLFLQTSWENSGKKGDYAEFVKTCEVKWQEMTFTEKEEYNKKDNIENDKVAHKRPRKVCNNCNMSKFRYVVPFQREPLPGNSGWAGTVPFPPVELYHYTVPITLSGTSLQAKKEKDPNKPKRPPSSYLLFCEANREEVKKSKPGLSMTGIIKELSVRWNAVDAIEKQKYIDLAEKEKEKYKELLKQDETQE